MYLPATNVLTKARFVKASQSFTNFKVLYFCPQHFLKQKSWRFLKMNQSFLQFPNALRFVYKKNCVPSYASLEEASASVTGGDAIMLARSLVATHATQRLLSLHLVPIGSVIGG